jgi:hypothetical protein
MDDSLNVATQVEQHHQVVAKTGILDFIPAAEHRAVYFP